MSNGTPTWLSAAVQISSVIINVPELVHLFYLLSIVFRCSVFSPKSHSLLHLSSHLNHYSSWHPVSFQRARSSCSLASQNKLSLIALVLAWTFRMVEVTFRILCPLTRSHLTPNLKVSVYILVYMYTNVNRIAGCDTDKANNILVDPSGNQVECTDTNLTPDGSDQLSTW
jgi:hypothetical protein